MLRKKLFAFTISALISPAWLYAQEVPENNANAVQVVSQEQNDDSSTIHADMSIEELEKLAAEGDVQAQFELGIIYFEGKKAKRNLEESKKWFHMVADHDFAEAQYNLALIYKIAENHQESDIWMNKAAESGHPKALYNIAITAMESKNKEERQKAIEWIKLSSDAGYTKAQMQLAKMIENGLVAEKKIEDAFALYMLAAKGGDSDAQFIVALMLSKGLGVEQNLQEALHWANIAGKNGNESALEFSRLLEVIMSDEQIQNSQKEEEN